MIELYIKSLIKQVKEDKISEKEILDIYKIYKRHELTPEEIEHGKTIIPRIKSNELTEEILINKAKRWK